MLLSTSSKNWTEWKEEKDREKAANNACGLKGVTAEEVKEFGGGRDISPGKFEPQTMTVTKISLMQSTRGKSGMIYTELGFSAAREEPDGER